MFIPQHPCTLRKKKVPKSRISFLFLNQFTNDYLYRSYYMRGIPWLYGGCYVSRFHLSSSLLLFIVTNVKTISFPSKLWLHITNFFLFFHCLHVVFSLLGSRRDESSKAGKHWVSSSDSIESMSGYAYSHCPAVGWKTEIVVLYSLDYEGYNDRKLTDKVMMATTQRIFRWKEEKKYNLYSSNNRIPIHPKKCAY